jgi:CrcB protein
MIKSILIVAVGGALGAVGRHLLVAAIPAATLPVGVLAANLSGSFALGLLVGFGALGAGTPEWLRLLLVVGLLGGFTTFSSFALEAALLTERGMSLLALLYVLVSVCGALGLFWLGMKLPRLIAGA